MRDMRVCTARVLGEKWSKRWCFRMDSTNTAESGPTLALSGVTVCLEMDLLLDETWPVFGALHSCAAAELVAVGLLEALKGALSKFQGRQRLLGMQSVVLVSHQPSLVSKCDSPPPTPPSRVLRKHERSHWHGPGSVKKAERLNTANSGDRGGPRYNISMLYCRLDLHLEVVYGADECTPTLAYWQERLSSTRPPAFTDALLAPAALAVCRLISEGMLEIVVLALEAAVRDLSRATPAGSAQRAAQTAAAPPTLGNAATAGRRHRRNAQASSSCANSSSHARSGAPRSSAAGTAASSVLHRAKPIGGGRGAEASAAAALRVLCHLRCMLSALRCFEALPPVEWRP